jgi:uncharacterized protein (DUF2225 family)
MADVNAAVKSKLKLLLKKEDLVEKYLAKYGDKINITHIKEIKATDDENLAPLPPLPATPIIDNSTTIVETESAIGDDPVYENLVTCPICNNTQVVSYNLKAKSQIVEETCFLVPHYGGIAKYHKENFNLIQTIVCPKCLFASPDPKDFTKINKVTERITKSQIMVHSNFISALRDSEKNRINNYGGEVEIFNDLKRPRSEAAAIVALKLSISRAKLEIEFDFPFSYYKVGSYYLKIADIQKSMGVDNYDSIKEAATFFENAIIESNCPKLEVELEALYLLIATNIKIDKKDVSGSFIKMFKDLKAEYDDKFKENPRSAELKKDCMTIDKWDRRASNAWSYRDEEHFWREV